MLLVSFFVPLEKLKGKDPEWLLRNLSPSNRTAYEQAYRNETGQHGKNNPSDLYWLAMNVANDPAEFLQKTVASDQELLAVLQKFMVNCEAHDHADYLRIMAKDWRLMQKFFRHLSKQSDDRTVYPADDPSVRFMADAICRWHTVPAMLYGSILARGADFSRTVLAMLADHLEFEKPERVFELQGMAGMDVKLAAGQFMEKAIDHFGGVNGEDAKFFFNAAKGQIPTIYTVSV